MMCIGKTAGFALSSCVYYIVWDNSDLPEYRGRKQKKFFRKKSERSFSVKFVKYAHHVSEKIQNT